MQLILGDGLNNSATLFPSHTRLVACFLISRLLRFPRVVDKANKLVAKVRSEGSAGRAEHAECVRGGETPARQVLQNERLQVGGQRIAELFVHD